MPTDDIFGASFIRAERANNLELNGALPLALSPDSALWRSSSDEVKTLAAEYLQLQVDSDQAIFTALNALVTTMADLGASGEQLAPQILGRVTQPDGTPAARLQVGLDIADLNTDDARRSTAITGEDGSFVLAVPITARTSVIANAGLKLTGGNGFTTINNALTSLQGNGFLPTLTLPQPISPLPRSVIAQLQKLIDSAPSATPDPDDHALPALAVGEDECEIVFRKDTSSDRFPFGVMFRLTDPSLNQASVVFEALEPARGPRLSYYGALSPAAALLAEGGALKFHLAQRVSVDRPISIDSFRNGLAVNNLFGGTPIAGSLAIGYVVKMAQRWTPLGLALGDLVYSLPLAPGEQQRIAVVERTATSTVIDSETLDTSEALSFSEADDTSATATFGSAFTEAAAGGSHYDTQASSFSVAAAAGGGGVFPFGCMAGGVATSFGTSQSSGNTNTWMSGARDYTSDASQRTHSAVQRQAAARRHSSRTAMRLATASETDSVVTKVIANHNKTRALTMQYWEVLRMFDVTTVVEGVNLVCMVPLDVVKFLPFLQPANLTDAPDNRDEVLARYGQLLAHADILTRVVPGRYQRGLSLITDFASDPTTSVGSSSAPAEDVLHLSLTGTFLPLDEVSVTIVGKRGVRVGPIRLTGSPDPIPVDDKAFSAEEDLFGYLRTARTNTAKTTELVGDLALPPSVARQDIVGFEISRRMQRLDYHFAPKVVADLGIAQTLLGPLGALAENLVESAVSHPSVSKSYSAEQLEQEIGGPRPLNFEAFIPVPSTNPPTPSVSFVATTWGGSIQLPRSPYPIASRTIPPILSYASILEIEKTLKWVMRNTMTCSVAVFASLTPEERAVMLERYEIQLPPDDNGVRPAVPLLSCVTNNVLGYYGNSMVLPFIIPAEITELTAKKDGDQVVEPGITTAQIQDALTRFHTDGFDPPRSTISLPTKGVLGEAVLGHCPSAEKIDLTRFWNWQDSPGDEATAISPVSVPAGSLTAGLSAPSALTGLAPIITNFNTSPVAADTSLASGLVKLAESQKGFDINALTNTAGLTTLGGKTIDAAESARKDALKSASDLAAKAMETAASLYTGKQDQAKKDAKKKDKKGKGKSSGGSSSGGSSDGGSAGGDGSSDGGSAGDSEGDPGSGPKTFSLFFQHDSSTVSDAAKAGQLAALDDFITANIDGTTAVVVRGFASPEGTAEHNIQLAHDRADAAIAQLITKGVTTATRQEGGVLSGPPGDYPKLRRADITFS